MATFNQTQPVTPNNLIAEERDDNTGFINNQGALRSNPTPSSRSRVGIIFTNVPIPSGSTITNAILRVTSSGSVGDFCSIAVRANDVDDAADFATEADVDQRPVTAAAVGWTVIDIPSSSYRDSPNIANVLQEVIDRPGWFSGNDICLILIGDSGQTCFAGIQTTSPSFAPRLEVTYTEPSPPSAPAGSTNAQTSMRTVVPVVPG